MGLGLYDYQLDAIERMKPGCILCGGVGSGKSRTALGYYYKVHGADITSTSPRMTLPALDLYIITTARKRDSKEWLGDMAPFRLSDDPNNSLYGNAVVIDSWNNIKKYADVKGAFFIFDEQRVVGSGAWVKSFLKIAKSNHWILLSATPGDTWADYIPVFIANGFYRNRTEFLNNHAIFSRYTKFPKIERFVDQGRLIKYRKQILVDMDFVRGTTAHHEDVMCSFSLKQYQTVTHDRWDPFEGKPVENPSQLCYLMRKVVNSSDDRQIKLLEIFEDHPRLIIFYNFDYELDILHKIWDSIGVTYAEWNGHKHEPVPTSPKWAYFVQYTAGSEAWNCITTDTIVFFSQNYSYKVLEQASGRIDRLNTPFKDLYYYHLKSRSGIDLAISRALTSKKSFNERKYLERVKLAS